MYFSISSLPWVDYSIKAAKGQEIVIFCASHRVIFSLRESDIETFGFSDIIFAALTARRAISLRRSLNITAKQYNSPKANITEKTP